MSLSDLASQWNCIVTRRLPRTAAPSRSPSLSNLIVQHARFVLSAIGTLVVEGASSIVLKEVGTVYPVLTPMSDEKLMETYIVGSVDTS